MANIPTFDGKDKKACLMWVNHVEHTAKQARMTFREAVTSKAGPTVVTAISRYPNASDAQLKRIILESFFNIGTRTEASHYLKMMQMDNNDTLTAHNAEYEAVHTVAYGISAEEQNDEQILRAYANTLCNYAATKLNRKIVRRGSRIKTLKDAMEEAEILDSQSRQEKISQIERTATRITLQATNKATTATTTTLTMSAKTGAHNRTGSTDAGSRDTGTSPDGLSMTLSLSTTQETRT